MTDYQGIEVENLAEDRIEPVSGDDLYLSLDYNIQCYVQQAAKKVLKAKKAKRVSAILMNPQNGEILAIAGYPDYNLNDPFAVDETLSKEEQNKRMQMLWRNKAISDTYEPGSTFKLVTASAALQEGIRENRKATSIRPSRGMKRGKEQRLRRVRQTAA